MSNSGRNISVVKGRNRLILPKYFTVDSNLNPANEESDLFHLPKEDHSSIPRASVSDLKKFWEKKTAKPLIPSSPTWQKSPCLRKVCLKSRQRRFQEDFTAESLTPATPLTGQKRKHRTPRRLMSLYPERYSQLMSPSTTPSPNTHTDSLLTDSSWAIEESETTASEKLVRLSLTGITPFVEKVSLHDTHDRSLSSEVKCTVKDVVKGFMNISESTVIKHEKEITHTDTDDEVNSEKESKDEHFDHLVEGTDEHDESFNLSLLSESDIENDQKECDNSANDSAEKDRPHGTRNGIDGTKRKMPKHLGVSSTATENLALKCVSTRSSELNSCFSTDLHCYESSLSSDGPWSLKEMLSPILPESQLLNPDNDSELNDTDAALRKWGKRRNLKRPKRLEFDVDLSKDKDIYVPSPKQPKTPTTERHFEFSTATPTSGTDNNEIELSECTGRGISEYDDSYDIENECPKTSGYDTVLCTDYDTDFLNEALSDESTVSSDMDIDRFSDCTKPNSPIHDNQLTVNTELLPLLGTKLETNQTCSLGLGSHLEPSQTSPLSLHSDLKSHQTCSLSLVSLNETKPAVTSTLESEPRLGIENQISEPFDKSALQSFVEIEQPLNLSKSHKPICDSHVQPSTSLVYDSDYNNKFMNNCSKIVTNAKGYSKYVNAGESSCVLKPVQTGQAYRQYCQPQVAVLERNTSSVWKEFGIGTVSYGYQPSHDSTKHASECYNAAVFNSPDGPNYFAKPLAKFEQVHPTCRYMNVIVSAHKPANASVEVNGSVVQSADCEEIPSTLKNDSQIDTDIISHMESNVRQRLVAKRRKIKGYMDQLPEVLKDVHPYVISGWLSSTYLMAIAKKTDLINEMFNDPLDSNGEIRGWIVENCHMSSPSVFATDLLFRLFTLSELQQHSLTFLGHLRRYKAIKQCVVKRFSLNSNSWRKCVIKMKAAINSLFKYRVPQVLEFLMLHSAHY